jgi:hypothetical protein
MNKHLTADELVDLVYGIGEREHVERCVECSARLEAVLAFRASATGATPVSTEFLAAQRRNIYARMGERPQGGMKWVPALAAAACLIAVSVFVYHPEAQAPKPEIDEAQLFSDVYSMEQSTEPVAAKPIGAIFDQDQQ